MRLLRGLLSMYLGPLYSGLEYPYELIDMTISMMFLPLHCVSLQHCILHTCRALRLVEALLIPINLGNFRLELR